MSDIQGVKISGLPMADALTGPELLELVQNAVNKQSDLDSVKDWVMEDVTVLTDALDGKADTHIGDESVGVHGTGTAAFVGHGTAAGQVPLNSDLGTASLLDADVVTRRTTETGSTELPVGTEAQRDAVPGAGYMRFNSDTGRFEGYNGSVWAGIGGGAVGGSNDEIFVENGQTVTANYAIPAGRNAMSTGPVEVETGVTVTVAAGSRWVIL